MSKASFHRWRSKYGQVALRDVKRLKELERENSELKKLMADQLLNIKVLEQVNTNTEPQATLSNAAQQNKSSRGELHKRLQDVPSLCRQAR